MSMVAVGVLAGFITSASHVAHPQEIRLFAIGPELTSNDDSFRLALMSAVDWEFHLDQIYGDPYLPVVLFIEGSDTPLSNYDTPFNQKEGSRDIRETNFAFSLMYPYDSETAALADAMTQDLLRTSLDPEQLRIFEAENMDQLAEYAEIQEGGNALILFGYVEPN